MQENRIENSLEDLISITPKNPLLQAFSIDFRRALAQDYIDLMSRVFQIQIGKNLYSLKVKNETEQAGSKKMELLNKYPEWQSTLENPVDQIPLLFQNEKWQMIGNLIDANIDLEINLILFRNLVYSKKKSPILKKLLLSFLKKENQDVLYTFSYKLKTTDEKLLDLLIENGNQDVLSNLFKRFFSDNIGFNRQFRKTIEKSYPYNLLSIDPLTLSAPERYKILKDVLEVKAANVLNEINNKLGSDFFIKNGIEIMPSRCQFIFIKTYPYKIYKPNT
jgi:hypothetical protein